MANQSSAVVLIGPMGRGVAIVQDFYRGCPREVMGPGMLPITAVDTFQTLEELVDKMLARSDSVFVIVNHGNPQHGLLVPFMAGTQFTATGGVIDDLAALAKQAPSPDDARVRDVASKMGVAVTSAVRLIQKLGQLPARQRMLFFRGCNLGVNLTLLSAYKLAFGAVAVQAPNCRMFYLRMKPHRPSKRQTMQSVQAGKPTTPNTRRRTFTDPLSRLGPLIIDVRDIDGHTHVDSECFADDPAEAADWGAKLLPAWQPVLGKSEFVAEILWDNGQTSYATPLEISYRTRFVFAP